MIITMRAGVGQHVVDFAIDFFLELGCIVQVRDERGDPVMLAVTGPAVEKLGVERPPFIAKEESSNKFLFDHEAEFVEAWAYKEKKKREEEAREEVKWVFA